MRCLFIGNMFLAVVLGGCVSDSSPDPRATGRSVSLQEEVNDRAACRKEVLSKLEATPPNGDSDPIKNNASNQHRRQDIVDQDVDDCMRRRGYAPPQPYVRKSLFNAPN